MRREWDPADTGVLKLPSGRLVRGRGIRRPEFDEPFPDFGVYLLARPPVPFDWESRWIHWPDFRTPRDPEDAHAVLYEAWIRAGRQRVEIACGRGRGRTGTALACLAVLDGLSPDEAVDFVRCHYHPRAVETPWQRRFVAGTKV
ncbi:protein-tyrosine phosphatase family protein [Rhodococcus sp. B50]|uniref:protein-tyrosine phosphatase family protein n=1 Tax=Rhodococcus sp. B50 TaxID=2682847 RepID=UPI001BD55FEE|nr:protein-tyrosine phosphatase family protein [Rhodococcus sp. B50]MBS9373260.1 hypothetical protein [Rhodococcus sp. B50]